MERRPQSLPCRWCFNRYQTSIAGKQQSSLKPEMLPEKKISPRSQRIPGDLLQRQINPWVCPQWTPPALPWQFQEDPVPGHFIQLRNSPVGRAVSWEKCSFARPIPKKSISAHSRAWMTSLFCCSQQTPGREAALPDHLKWPFKRIVADLNTT